MGVLPMVLAVLVYNGEKILQRLNGSASLIFPELTLHEKSESYRLCIYPYYLIF